MLHQIPHKTKEINGPVYVISDIHGDLEKLLNLISKLPENATICGVGDLIDRGPDSKKVMKLFMDRNFDCVLGNHELMMIQDLPKLLSQKLKVDESFWLDNGGTITLSNFTRKETGEVSEKIIKYYNWLGNLPTYIRYKIPNAKDLFVSHSYMLPFILDDGVEAPQYLLSDHYGLSNGKLKKIDVSSRYEAVQYILWNRMHSRLFPASISLGFNVFGHTPRSKDFIFSDSAACIDNGCYLNHPGYGKLIALEYPSMRIITSD